jgi:hypothetical protein
VDDPGGLGHQVGAASSPHGCYAESSPAVFARKETDVWDFHNGLDWIVGFLPSPAASGLMAIAQGRGGRMFQLFSSPAAIFPADCRLSLYATNIARSTVGLTGDAYRYGLSAGTVELTTAICLALLPRPFIRTIFATRSHDPRVP